MKSQTKISLLRMRFHPCTSRRTLINSRLRILLQIYRLFFHFHQDYLDLSPKKLYSKKILSQIPEVALMQELLHGMLIFALYVIPAAGTMFLARRLIRIPDELFRKILHFILLGAYFPFLFAFKTWWISAGCACALILLFYPLLALAGRIPAFSSFVNERKEGEFKSSMVLALAMIAFSISICWGVLDDKLLTLACVYAWGVGDAFAALVGKRFGKHKIHLPLTDHRKSWEGSAAMFFASFLSVLIVLLVRGGLGVGSCLLISAVAAIVTTYTELATKDGLDTITCPTVAMAVIIPLVKLFGG